MTFAWDTTYYPTRLHYQAALMPFAVPAWVQGVTLHHTWKPTQDQWKGARSMEALKRFYRNVKGWPAGPHLFLAPDGIWAGTPLSSRGVHAGRCNVDHIGLEIVGDFDQQGWGVGLAERVYALIVLLLHWAKLDETVLLGHRECLANKSCPGAAINMDAVRTAVRDRLFDQHFIVTAQAVRVRGGPYIQAPILRSAMAGATFPAHLVRGRAYQGSSDWARVRLPSSAIGYIWAGLGRWERV